MSNSYDAIVIGSGHNGLVSAAYLARSGARTLVWNPATRWAAPLPPRRRYHRTCA